MTKEEYLKTIDKAHNEYVAVCKLADRCFLAENARLKVGDITVKPDSTEIVKVVERRVIKNYCDVDIIYTIESLDNGDMSENTQKELFKDE